MQTIWSRAVQTRCTCKCASCISTTSAVARQASVAAGKRFGRPGPSSTLLYSTIFAVAAVVDGGTKKKRRKQWEVAITNVKGDLRSVPEDERREEIDCGEEEIRVKDSNWPHVWREGLSTSTLMKELSQAVGMEISYKDTDFLGYEELNPEEAKQLWDLLRYDYRLPESPRPEWPPNLGPELQTWNLPPQSLWSSDVARSNRLGVKYGKKKYRTLEMSVAKLIHTLMLGSRLYKISESALENIPIPLHPIASLELTDLSKQLRIAKLEFEKHFWMSNEDFVATEESGGLEKSPVLSPRYAPDDLSAPDTRTCNQLNYAIRSLFEERSNLVKQIRRASNSNAEVDPFAAEKGSLVANICHNLLISPVAPDVQTYNILIAGFAKLRMTHACDITIQSMLETCTRPNELTCTHILNYYTSKGDANSFTKFVGRMRGQGSGIMLARRDINITDAGRSRLVRTWNGKVIQKVHPTPLVFRAIMRGVLRFTGIDRAVEIYDLMKEDRWGMDYKGLVQFLKAAVKERDWVNGNFIWEEIQALRVKKNVRIAPNAFALFMKLCRTTDHNDAYELVFADAVKYGYTYEALRSAELGEMTAAEAIRHGYTTNTANWMAQETDIKDSRDAEETARSRVDVADADVEALVDEVSAFFEQSDDEVGEVDAPKNPETVIDCSIVSPVVDPSTVLPARAPQVRSLTNPDSRLGSLQEEWGGMHPSPAMNSNPTPLSSTSEIRENPTDQIS